MVQKSAQHLGLTGTNARSIEKLHNESRFQIDTDNHRGAVKQLYLVHTLHTVSFVCSPFGLDKCHRQLPTLRK